VTKTAGHTHPQTIYKLGLINTWKIKNLNY